jgi:hypothetical protein
VGLGALGIAAAIASGFVPGVNTATVPFALAYFGNSANGLYNIYQGLR